MEKGKWKRILLMVMLFSVVFFASCSCSGGDKDIAVRSLTISASHKELQENTEFSLTYTIAPIETSISGVYISVSDSNVLQLHTTETNTNSGEIKLTAKKAGTSTVTIVTKDGEFVKTCKVDVFNTTTLATPANVTFKNNSLTWDAVNSDIDGGLRNAVEKYKVIVKWENNEEEIIVEDNKLFNTSSFSFAEDVYYEVSVQALGDDLKNYNSETSDVYSFYLLSTPKLNINNGLVSWKDHYANTEFDVANYFILTYSPYDYEIIANNGDFNKNYFDLKPLGLENYEITIQSIKTHLSPEDIEVAIEQYMDGAAELPVSEINGIHFIESKVSKTFSIRTLLKPENIKLVNNQVESTTINDITIASAFKTSSFKWEGEQGEYKNKLRYMLVFSKGEKSLSTLRPAGVNEFTLTKDFIETVLIGQLGVTASSSGFGLEIISTLASDEDANQFILPTISEKHEFNYISLTPEDFNLTLNDNIISFTQPSFFPTLQFIFVNNDKRQSITYLPSNGEINVLNLLDGMSGKFEIFASARGQENTMLNNINIACSDIDLQKLTCDGLEVVAINDSYVLRWNNSEHAQRYKISGLGEDIVIYTESDKSAYFNESLNKWYYPINILPNDMKLISVQAVAKESTQNQWFINSDVASIQVAKFPEVEFELIDRTITWQSPVVNNRTEGYIVEVIEKESGNVIYANDSVGMQQNSFNTASLEEGDYVINVTLKAILGALGTSLYVLDSDMAECEFTKLAGVTFDVENGKLVWNRTVEGKPNTAPHTTADNYIIYKNGEEFSMTITEDNDKMIADFEQILVTNSYFSIAVNRESGEGNFVISDESTPILVSPITATNFEKSDELFTFTSATLIDGIDVAEGYVITGVHSQNQNYAYEEVYIEANGEYFVDGKYKVPVSAIDGGSGEYTFYLETIGRMYNNIAYLGSFEKQSLTVIQLENPFSNQVTVDRGELTILRYYPASESIADSPVYVKIFFYQNDELYNQPITYLYSNFDFTQNSRITLMLPSEFVLEAGSYEVYVQFIGDGNNYILDSEKIFANDEMPVEKLPTISVYIENGQLKWGQEARASKYIVTLNSSTPENVEENFLPTNEWQAGTTTVQVVAYADNYLMSDPSQIFTAKKLNAPLLSPNVVDGTKVISWNELLEGVTTYNVYQQNETNELLAQISDKNYWQINKDQLMGDASYFVIAKGSLDTRTQDNKLLGYLDSNSSSELPLIFIAPSLEAFLVSGTLTWQPINGALNYRVDLYDHITYYEDKQLKHTTTVSGNKFNPSTFTNIQSGAYIAVVSVDRINASSNVVVSTYSENFTHTLPIVKIDNLDGVSIYDNLRVEDGKFAFDITSEFLNSYRYILSEIYDSSLYLQYITLEAVQSILDGEGLDEAMAYDLLHPLTNFNVYLKHNDNSVVKLEQQTPTSYKKEANHITLYYEIQSMAGMYSIEFEQLGNTSNMEVVGVITGSKTQAMQARKTSQPLSPISESGVSINNGKLVWIYPDMFDGDFIIELTDEDNEVIVKTVTVGSVVNPSNPWQAVKVNNVITLDLVTCVTEDELQSEVAYSIKLYAKGTVSGTSGEMYLNGETNNIQEMFKVLAAPENFSVERGELYWETVEGAVGYLLTFYLHDGNNYTLVEVNGSPNVFVDNGENQFNLQNTGLEHGNYRIELRAVGNNENIINLPSRVVDLYAVLLDKVSEIFIEDGRFAFEEIFYNDIDPEDGTILEEKAAEQYFAVVVERRDGRVIDSVFVGYQNLKKENDLYFIELGDNFRLDGSDYQVEVYANGDNEYLLSGNVVVSEHFMRSTAPTHFTIDEDGLITWEHTDDYYVVFVSEQRVMFDEDGESKNYTSNNYFNINDYVKSISGEYNKEYNFYVRALKDNNESVMPIIRSERAGKLQLFVMEPPTISLVDGDINWQSDIYQSIHENIAQSYLTISGNFLINGVESNATLTVLCSADFAVFENKEYIVQPMGDGQYYIDINNQFMSGITIAMIDDASYEFSLQYIGNVGDVMQESYVYVTSSIEKVDGFISQERPKDVQGVSGEMLENDISNNFIMWSPIDGATGYRIKVYGYNSLTDELELVMIYETSAFTSPLFGVHEGNGKLYFAVDETVKFFNENGYGQIVVYEIVAKGESWEKGVGSKTMSSVPSDALEIDYPLSPNKFAYNGKGAITWENASGGTAVIEIKYKVETGDGYYNVDNFINNHEHEIITRRVEGGYAIDVIEVPDQNIDTNGYYQLKYLTSDIEYITIKTRFEGLNSRLLRLDKSLDGTLSQGYAKFDLFFGGDGSVNAPFVVKDKASLYNINHYLNSHFELQNNVVLTGNWTPIGSALNTVSTVYNGRETSFKGTFNGNEFMLSNVNLHGEDVTLEGRRYAGLFYATEEDTIISNLTVVFASENITASTGINLIVGGIVAKTNKGTINNVTVAGNMIATSSDNNRTAYLGGIAFDNYGEIKNCTSTLNIKHYYNRQTYVGGIAVNNYNLITTTGVYHTGINDALSGTTVGGVVAVNYSDVFESYFNGRLKVNANAFSGDCYFGGITAIADGLFDDSGEESVYLPSSVEECYAIVISSTVEWVSAGSNCYGGGLVGSNISVENIVKLSFVSLQSYTGSNNGNNTVRIGVVYGYHPQGETSRTQDVYYSSDTLLGYNIAGSDINSTLSWGGVKKEETIDLCVAEINSQSGYYIFRAEDGADGQRHIKLHWQ